MLEYVDPPKHWKTLHHDGKPHRRILNSLSMNSYSKIQIKRRYSVVKNIDFKITILLILMFMFSTFVSNIGETFKQPIRNQQV